MMTVRKIVRIDEAKCDGCGLCVPACHEGAIKMIDGKARLVDERMCDGLGDCLGECPQGAITVEERSAPEYDAQLVAERAQSKPPPPAGVCPGLQLRQFGASTPTTAPVAAGASASQLRQWPVQLHLVPPQAPFLQGRSLLLAADCTTVALGGFQQLLLRNRALLLACPKLDNTSSYLQKLVEILQSNETPELVVAMMEVPCCQGLLKLAQQAIGWAQTNTRLRVVVVGIEGGLVRDEVVAQEASASCPSPAGSST